MNYKYTDLNHSSINVIMTTIAEEVLTELSSTTEQSGEGPGQPGGIARSVAATQKSILRQVFSHCSITEQSGEGPGQSGGIARSVKTAPNAKSALGGKGVKRKINIKNIDTKYEAIMGVETGEIKISNSQRFRPLKTSLMPTRLGSSSACCLIRRWNSRMSTATVEKRIKNASQPWFAPIWTELKSCLYLSSENLPTPDASRTCGHFLWNTWPTRKPG